MFEIEYVAAREGGFAVITFDEEVYDHISTILDTMELEDVDLFDTRAWVSVESKRAYNTFMKEFMNAFSRLAVESEVL